MGGAEFKAWMTRCGLSNRTASAMLGLSRRTVVRYVNGQSVVPQIVQLACSHIEENRMAYSKTIPMHKRLASGEPVTGMKKGGKADCYKDGGAVKKGNPFAKKGNSKAKEC